MQQYPFDPTRHLSLINGNEYLEVKWRLVWFRDVYPSGAITTEMVSHANNQCVFRAEVVGIDADGVRGGSATGWGSEDAQSFGDYIEKAETKAVGRALAALGFGSQFCTDFDFGAAQGRVVDSPVALNNRPARQQAPAQDRPAPNIDGGLPYPNASSTVTEQQGKKIYAMLRGANMDAKAFVRQFADSDYTSDLPGGQANMDYYLALIEGRTASGGRTATMRDEHR